jgi:hypothetical protein
MKIKLFHSSSTLVMFRKQPVKESRFEKSRLMETVLLRTPTFRDKVVSLLSYFQGKISNKLFPPLKMRPVLCLETSEFDYLMT